MQDQTIKIKNQFAIMYSSSNDHILSITLPLAINQYVIVRQEDLK